MLGQRRRRWTDCPHVEFRSSKHQTLNRYCFNVWPASQITDLPQTIVASINLLCLSGISYHSLFWLILTSLAEKIVQYFLLWYMVRVYFGRSGFWSSSLCILYSSVANCRNKNVYIYIKILVGLAIIMFQHSPRSRICSQEKRAVDTMLIV